MHDHAHRLVGDLGVTVGDRDRHLLVEAEQHGRVLVAEVVDQAVVQAGEARSRVLHDVSDAEPSQHFGGDIADVPELGIAGDAWSLGLEGLLHGRDLLD